MPLGNFAEAGTLPKPLTIGRTARFLAGVGALVFFVWSIFQLSALTSSDRLNLGYLVGVAFA